jgi:phage host-nuclease inhibitor protein Gam
MADNNNLLKEKADLIEKIKRIQSEQGKDAAKLNDVYIKSVDRLKDIVKSLKDVIDEQNKTVRMEAVENLINMLEDDLKKLDEDEKPDKLE